MIVYHGGTSPIEEPLADYNHEHDLDFGHGFYTTMNLEEAEMWAALKAEEEYGVPIVNEYMLDDSYTNERGYLLFDDTDDAWFDFLDHCRSGEIYYQREEHPIVEGEVADDNGYEIFESYHKGDISKQHALDQLSDMNLGWQICFRTDEVIDSYLEYNRHFFI